MRRYRVWLGRTEKPFSRVVEATDCQVTDTKDGGYLEFRVYGESKPPLVPLSHTVAIFRPGNWSYVREIR